MSIDAGAQVTIILLACRPCVVIVNCLGQVLYLGRTPRTKETLPDFRECREGYPTSMSIPRVDGLSTDTPVLGRHTNNAYLVIYVDPKFPTLYSKFVQIFIFYESIG